MLRKMRQGFQNDRTVAHRLGRGHDALQRQKNEGETQQHPAELTFALFHSPQEEKSSGNEQNGNKTGNVQCQNACGQGTAQIGAENGGQSSRRRYQSAGLQTCYEK